MTRHSALDQPAISLQTFTWHGSVARNFMLRVPLPFTEIWYYSGTGCVLPSKCALYDNNGTLVPGTLKTSPVWSGAAGSGWVSTTYDGSITIPANLNYQANCFVNGTAGFEGVTTNPAVTNGDIYASNGYYDSSGGTGSGDISYVTGINSNTFLVDIGVSTPSSFSVVSDNFNRSNGGLGANWTVSPDTGAEQGTLSISSNAVGGSGNNNAASSWTASAASDDQYAEVTIGTTLPAPSGWVGPAVRVSADGKNQYILIAFNNGGTYLLELFKQFGSGYTALGATSWTGAAPGDVIRIEAFGKNITGFLNGNPVLMAQDTAIKWGAPGVAVFGNTPSIDSWASASVDTSLNVQLTGTSGHVSTYSVSTPVNRSKSGSTPSGPQSMRVLTPTTPSSTYAHAFLWLLPVEPGQGTTFGDPIAQVQALGLQNTYNLTCIQPGFPIDPWYADNDSDPGVFQETYMRMLVAWAKANLRSTGLEAHYLIGFSKSGVGGQRLFWRNQDLFSAVASWDFPGAETYSQFGSDSAAVYGTQANFDNNYSTTSGHLTAWKLNGNTGTKSRIWIADGVSFDDSSYDTELTGLSILHTYVHHSYTVHNWVSSPDWVGPAVAFMAGVGPPPAGGLLMSSLV